MLELDLNSPRTSSMGRLFDTISALAGVRTSVNYEAQAAIEFEALVDPSEGEGYEFAIEEDTIDPSPLFAAVVSDLRAGIPVHRIAARFHNGVSEMVARVCRKMGEESGSKAVALSGGVWQNRVLLQRVLALLRGLGFQVYIHRQVPTNDGGICLGQVAVAMHQSRA
jgi:hydrogenase maturation protein HypF